MTDTEPRDIGAGLDKFEKGDYAVAETDENDALSRLAKKNVGVIVITITPKYSTKTLTKAEDVFQLEMTDDKLNDNVQVIKNHLKSLLNSQVVDKMMERVTGEVKHG